MPVFEPLIPVANRIGRHGSRNGSLFPNIIPQFAPRRDASPRAGSTLFPGSDRGRKAAEFPGNTGLQREIADETEGSESRDPSGLQRSRMKVARPAGDRSDSVYRQVSKTPSGPALRVIPIKDEGRAQARITSSAPTPRNSKTRNIDASMRLFGHDAPAVIPIVTGPSPRSFSE